MSGNGSRNGLSRHRRVAPRTRVALLTTVRLHRDGVARVVADDSDFELVGAGASAAELRGQLTRVTPDVFLIDASMLRASADAVTLVGTASDARIVAYAIAADDEDTVLACAEAGATGFLARDAAPPEVIAAIQSVVRGDVHFSAGLATIACRQFRQAAERRRQATASTCMTSREAQIVRLLEEGLPNKMIAARLGIELSTVKNHVHNVMAKLAVHGRRDAVVAARAVDARNAARSHSGGEAESAR